MAELKPEIQRVQEKYKDPAQRNKAMQELYRKHNFNPFGGCLLMFVQLPIFVGLYRSLMVDVELRQSAADLGCRPLVLESCRPRHALGLDARRAGVYPKLSRPLFECLSVSDHRAVHLAAKNVHAPAGRRASRDATEDDVVHDASSSVSCSIK